MSDRRSRWLAGLGLLAVTATWFALLFCQVRWPEPFLNDSVLHFGLIRSLASAAERGQSILDPWVPGYTLGYPVFHYYQSLPHFTVLAFDAITPFSLVRSFKIVEWLAVATLPIPVFLAMRVFGFGRLAALLAAALALGARTDSLHGLDFESYTWQGLGQYAQAFGGWFFPLALALSWRAVRGERGLFGATLALSVTFLSHFALGYMACMAAGIVAFAGPVREIPRRLGRVAIIGAITGLVILPIAVPIFRDFAWYNVSTLVPSWKYNSFGHEVVLRWLVTGKLFDFARWPVLTVLVGAGLVVASARIRRSERDRVLLVWFVFFLLLFFGRPTWGKLLHLLPLGSGFHYSRAVYVVQQVGTMLAGAGLAAAAIAIARRGRVGVAAAVALVVIAIAPIAWDRVTYLRWNSDLVQEAAAGLEKDGADLDRALADVAADRFGRVYAGQGRPGSGWGGNFMVGWTPVYAWLPLRELDAFGYLYHMWSLNADCHDTFDEGNVAHYRAFGIRHVLTPSDLNVPPFAKRVATHGRFAVWEVDVPGLVDLVDVPYALDVSKRNVTRVHRKWLKSSLPAKGVHPAIRLTEAGLPRDPEALAADGIDFRPPDFTPAGSPGEILERERLGEDFRVRVRADRPCHVVLKMTYHPGWHATLDGAETETVHVMPSYVAVAVPAGEHEVTFRYRGGRDRGPLGVVAACALLGLFGVERRRRRGLPPGPLRD
ncbi:MAG: hypothetical protein R3B81_15305 [bacterium]